MCMLLDTLALVIDCYRPIRADLVWLIGRMRTPVWESASSLLSSKITEQLRCETLCPTGFNPYSSDHLHRSLVTQCCFCVLQVGVDLRLQGSSCWSSCNISLQLFQPEIVTAVTALCGTYVAL